MTAWRCAQKCDLQKSKKRKVFCSSKLEKEYYIGRTLLQLCATAVFYVLRFGARLASGGRGRRGGGGGGGGGGGSSGEGDGSSICGGRGAASAVLVATDEDSDVGVRPCGGE